MADISSIVLPTSLTAEGLSPSDARQLKSYLYQLTEQLRYVLANLDSDNMSASYNAGISAAGVQIAQLTEAQRADIEALRQMGAVCDCSPECVCCSAGPLHEAVITLPFPRVGATENAILAALGCAGSVEIQNAAREPEIMDLVRFLQSAGAKISGVGTAKLTVCGGTPLHGTTYTIMPDRIETASFLCAVAGCGGDVTLLRTQRATSEAVCQILEHCGCQITEGCDTLRICTDHRLRACAGTIVTAPYPGFPTDAQAPMMAALLRAEGESRICETIFENRFHHVPQLRKLGADIALYGQTACVRAVEHLHGAAMHAEDLRGAMALVIGALQSEEESTITGIKHLRRGYDNLEENLRALGADIKCMEIC